MICRLLLACLIFLPISCFAMVGFGSMDPTTEEGHFFAAFEGALVQQTNDGNAYTLLDSTASETLPVGKLKRVNPDHEPLGGALMGYLFDNMTDIRFSFFIHDHSATSGLSAADIGVTRLWASLIIPTLGPYLADSASSKHQYKVDDFSLAVGHWFSPFETIHARPYLGLGVFYLENDQSTNYLGGDFLSYVTVKEKASVSEVGPVIGTGLSCDLYGGLTLEGDFRFGLLTGNLRSSYRIESGGANALEIQLNDKKIRSRTNRLVFESFNIQVGLGYHGLIRDIETQVVLGYKIAEYFSATAVHLATGGSDFENTGFSGGFLSVGFRFT